MVVQEDSVVDEAVARAEAAKEEAKEKAAKEKAARGYERIRGGGHTRRRSYKEQRA